MKSPPPRKTKAVNFADAGQHLLQENKEALVQLILDWAKDDGLLQERLIFYAARQSGPGAAAGAVAVAA